MSASVFTLPNPLVLLIHLHLLQYPHANKPEYDHNLFDARVRGLRDRTRTMEDICYFLITRIEGSKERARKVIATYPCAQPAETMAFRTSLAKFLDNLRHASISSTQRKGGIKFAWWWKDLVVRKSLLEECAGERFERLMLALSTHALLKGSTIHAEMHQAQTLLRSQPRVYVAQLATFQSRRNIWARAAALLDQRQHDLRILHAHVQGHSTKYASLSTVKLQAVADSTLPDLLVNAGAWADPAGRTALAFLADLCGLAPPETLSDPQNESQLTHGTPTASSPLPPLPIAAAHHPDTLRKLSKRLFSKTPKQTTTTPTPTTSKKRRLFALDEKLDAETRMGQALSDALALVRTRNAASARRRRPSPRALRPMDMNLWHPAEVAPPFDFASPQMALDDDDADVERVEARVAAIRADLLPKYPPLAAAVQSAPQTPSKKHKSQGLRAPPETIKAPRRPVSIPPFDAHNQDDWAGATPRPSRTAANSLKPSYADAGEDSDSDSNYFGDEGGSMSVRDLLLQAGSSYLGIIADDDSSDAELGEESFGWA
ncbi:hypothetical protein C8R46DRAFT_1189658 [Mycena filopes]|nr:hypothetical protein C8R46DRAFT_1189658 [Mycena filopes]